MDSRVMLDLAKEAKGHPDDPWDSGNSLFNAMDELQTRDWIELSDDLFALYNIVNGENEDTSSVVACLIAAAAAAAQKGAIRAFSEALGLDSSKVGIALSQWIEEPGKHESVGIAEFVRMAEE